MYVKRSSSPATIGQPCQTGKDGKQFAQKFLCDEGKHNGLFWKAAAGELPSPLGPLIVSASYRTSGVMTFMAGWDGIAYWKELGRETSRLAAFDQAYDPDNSWKAVFQEDEEQSADTDH
jgi:hypothetical protein